MLANWRPLLCALLLAGFAHAAGAQSEGPDFWAVTGVASNDVLNLRVAPNADSRMIARIPYNARGLKNFGCPNEVSFEQWLRMTEAQRDKSARSRWCEVEYQGKKGWVAGRFLKEDGAPQKK
jgi:uncharacterized protein YgiM (DUF1202 family)